MKKAISKAVARVMKKACILNQKTDYAVFVSLSGHVSHIDVRVCAHKESFDPLNPTYEDGKEVPGYNFYLYQAGCYFDHEDGDVLLKLTHIEGDLDAMLNGTHPKKV